MKTTYHEDTDGTWYLNKTQDVEPFVKAAADARHEHRGYRSEVFNKKASIPIVVAKQWCKQSGIDYGDLLADPSILRRFLNDPDNAAFMHIKGRV